MQKALDIFTSVTRESFSNVKHRVTELAVLIKKDPTSNKAQQALMIFDKVLNDPSQIKEEANMNFVEFIQADILMELTEIFIQKSPNLEFRVQLARKFISIFENIDIRKLGGSLRDETLQNLTLVLGSELARYYITEKSIHLVGEIIKIATRLEIIGLCKDWFFISISSGQQNISDATFSTLKELLIDKTPIASDILINILKHYIAEPLILTNSYRRFLHPIAIRAFKILLEATKQCLADNQIEEYLIIFTSIDTVIEYAEIISKNPKTLNTLRTMKAEYLNPSHSIPEN